MQTDRADTQVVRCGGQLITKRVIKRKNPIKAKMRQICKQHKTPVQYVFKDEEQGKVYLCEKCIAFIEEKDIIEVKDDYF